MRFLTGFWFKDRVRNEGESLRFLSKLPFEYFDVINFLKGNEFRLLFRARIIRS